MLILCSIICLGFSRVYFVFSPLLLQIIGFVCAGVAIIIIGRYSLVEYEYEIEEEHFKVTKILGKKRTVTAYLELKSFTALYEKTKGNSLSDKLTKKITLKQNCKLNIFAKQVFYAVFDTEDGLFVLELELCEEMKTALEKLLES